jgi:N-methylhydantoinase A
MSSSGGAMSATAAGRLAIRTAVSGPAAGVAGAFAVAGAAGHRSIITLDMGGTSTDVALCPGDVPFRDETRVGAFPVRGPTVDVLSVGAGGGSIARIDAGGALRVGPESAGADPGPSCYGQGEDPTVTDAHVVLGRIVPREFLGGRMRLYPDRARKAISRLGGGADAAAAAVLRVATANMERAVRAVSVERGYDPRMFTLVAFGGAGPLHACDVAESLRIKRIIVPAYPGVLSALGMASAPVVKDLAAALAVSLGPGDRGLLQARRAVLKTAERLEATGRRELAREGFPLERLSARRILEMRYAGQSYELPVDADSDNPRRWAQSFHQSHEARFNHSDASRPVEIMGARVRLALPPSAGERPPAALAPRRRSAAVPRAEQRACLQGDFHVAAVYSREDVAAGSRLAGPAIVVQMDSTTVINPGWGARADGWGNLVLERR